MQNATGRTGGSTIKSLGSAICLLDNALQKLDVN
jgi:hypothetical protein